eukprot:g31998.t1
MAKAGESSKGGKAGKGGKSAVRWPQEEPLHETQSQDSTGSFFDAVVSFAKSSGAADVWNEWFQYTQKYCRCAG